jgi:REP element-mobilizing transposase RayT
MSNHLHWIASTPDDVLLSDMVRDFKKHTSKAIVHSIENEPGESRKGLS